MVGSLLCVEQVELKLRRSVHGNSNGVDGLRAVRIRLFCSVELFCLFERCLVLGREFLHRKPLAVFADQLANLKILVESAEQDRLRTFDRGDTPRVFDQVGLYFGVRRKFDEGVDPLDDRQFVNRNREGLRRVLVVLDGVFKVA